MSEPPASDPKKPELKDLLIAVKDIVNWHDLGLHLDLPESKLASIATHPDIEGHRRMMLSEWLQFDPEASWEKLATALSKIGKNAIAANVRREFVIVSGPHPPAQSPEQEAKKRMLFSQASPSYPEREKGPGQKGRTTVGPTVSHVTMVLQPIWTTI